MTTRRVVLEGGMGEVTIVQQVKLEEEFKEFCGGEFVISRVTLPYVLDENGKNGFADAKIERFLINLDELDEIRNAMILIVNQNKDENAFHRDRS